MLLRDRNPEREPQPALERQVVCLLLAVTFRKILPGFGGETLWPVLAACDAKGNVARRKPSANPSFQKVVCCLVAVNFHMHHKLARTHLLQSTIPPNIEQCSDKLFTAQQTITIRLTMLAVQAKNEAALIEPDCEPPSKKRRIDDSKSHLAPALLQLTAISMLRGGQHPLAISCPGPLLHPSAFYSFPSHTPCSGRIAASPEGAYATTISASNSGEADEEQPTQHCVKQANATSLKTTDTSFAHAQPSHFPPARPLPSAPCFPACPPPPPPLVAASTSRGGLATIRYRFVAIA